MKNTASQIEGIKSQTLGVEVEMNSIKRSDAAKVAATYFGTGRFKNTADRNGYYTWSAWDAQGREWKFQRDVSISGPDAEKCELVTPILHYDDIELLQGLIRELRHAGARSSAERGCGIHCHVGAQGHTPQTLRNLANIMASHEQLLIRALGIDPARTSRYCRTVDPDFLAALNKKKPQTMAGLADIWYTTQGASYGRDQHYNSSRYHMLNLHATFTKGTVEFRLFNGTMHAGRIKTYIQLCLGMSALAKEVRTASCRPQQSGNDKYAMRTWLLRIGFIGEEFSTARDFLTRDLSGDTAFRNGRAAA